MENRRKIEPKEIPSRLIPRLLVVFTRQLEILVSTLHRVSGLQVRGYNSDLKIPIPVAYTSTSIPAHEDHKPTKTTAKNWSHLQPIEDKILNLLDCNVGSQVGYACSQALTPREVISGESTKLYAIKTDLGWSIVGGGQAESVRSFCQRAVVRELHVPAITMNGIV